MAIGTTAAILGAAALGTAGAVAGSKAQSNAAKSAANASQQASDQSIAEQRRQYDLSRQDNAPWLAAGQGALSQLSRLYGLSAGVSPQQGVTGSPSNSYLNTGVIPTQQSYALSGMGAGAPLTDTPGEGIAPYEAWAANQQYGAATPVTQTPAQAQTPSAGTGAGSNMASFFASPDYQFRQNEQMRALTARNASLGIQDSGAAQKAALQYSGNLASGEFNNYANRLAALAGVGQTAAAQNQNLGQNYAGAVGNILGNNAQNLASSYQQRGAANANLYGNIAGIGAGLLGNFSNPLRGLY